MKKYTVFLGKPDDAFGPPYWIQIKAETSAEAVVKAQVQAAEDFGGGYEADDNDFPLVVIVNGWPKFSFELEEER